MDTQHEAWGDDLAGAEGDDPAGAVTDALAHLAEPPIEGVAGTYWTRTPSDDDEVEAAYDAAVQHALKALEDLLAVRPRATRGQSDAARERALRREALLLAAVDRALADPTSGYLRRLRARRSAILRERMVGGATMAGLATELGVTPARVRALVNNNQSYVSASRTLALEALRAQGEAERATRRAAKAAEKQRAVADRAAARAVQGRALQARLDVGVTRADLQAELGISRQALATLLTAARNAEVPA